MPFVVMISPEITLYNHYQTNLTYHNFLSVLLADCIVQCFVIALLQRKDSSNTENTCLHSPSKTPYYIIIVVKGLVCLATRV